MEGAGKLVEDDELREAMAEKGLGTPATRAQIIEGLIEDHYILRHGKELQPTAKAFSLMVLLNGLGVETLTKPELTGEWEHKLKQMERGQLRRDVFMNEIRGLTQEIVTRAKSYELDTIPGDFGKLTTPAPAAAAKSTRRTRPSSARAPTANGRSTRSSSDDSSNPMRSRTSSPRAAQVRFAGSAANWAARSTP
jgi:hypothetical protein